MELKDIKMEIQEIVRFLLKNGLTQSDIARRCEISQTLVSLINTGKRNNVLVSTYKKLYQLMIETKIHQEWKEKNNG
ncbi:MULTISPECIES: hypothetical protein [Oligella]|uniref:HTH cro/C1-type domain-containing protein n=1 Tax=Oligella urethralis TaxID=90245 RepID=A0A2X1UPU2_9BURK|nr:hypothetical protein [Oligella urethralis]SPY09119.1 Uncharacterised protein [Oligella urethralis]